MLLYVEDCVKEIFSAHLAEPVEREVSQYKHVDPIHSLTYQQYVLVNV